MSTIREAGSAIARRFAALSAGCFATCVASHAAMARPINDVHGLDHVSLAVADLDRAVSDFRQLGFTIKPGRHHGDGIRNAHVKFADGTYIELITASHPTDALASEYADWLTRGDGPIFWSLYAPDLGRLRADLAAIDLAPEGTGVVTFPQGRIAHRFFFSDRPPSPTDRPAYFVHPSTAYGLAAVWLSGTDIERGLIGRLGGVPTHERASAPFAADVKSYSFAEGQHADYVAVSGHRPTERSLLGVTVAVAHMAALTAILDANNVEYQRVPGCGREAVWVRPAAAHGTWIEFRGGR